MNKAKVNYLLDIVIGLSFLMAGITGVAFLFMGSDGYQGGRNPGFSTMWLGLARETWSDLHTLGSLVMMAGVGLHLVLHFKWLACVTKQMLPKLPQLRRREEQCEVTA